MESENAGVTSFVAPSLEGVGPTNRAESSRVGFERSDTKFLPTRVVFRVAKNTRKVSAGKQVVNDHSPSSVDVRWPEATSVAFWVLESPIIGRVADQYLDRTVRSEVRSVFESPFNGAFNAPGAQILSVGSRWGVDGDRSRQ